jgi:hypothetical protein
MSVLEMVRVIWPALFCLAGLLLYLLFASQRGHGNQIRYICVISTVSLLAVSYLVSNVLLPVRWTLTAVGFAAPIGVSIVGIRYLIEET